MNIIYLVRHVETESNKAGITQGQRDSPITEVGKKQLDLVTESFRNVKIDRIFTSDIGRAMITAEAINKHHSAPMVSTPILRERSKGDWEGVSKKELLEKNPWIEGEWKKEADIKPPNGENIEDVSRRVIPFFKKAILDFPGQTLIFVTHGNVNKAIIGHFLDIPYGLQYRLGQDHGSISKITVDGRNISVDYVNKQFNKA